MARKIGVVHLGYHRIGEALVLCSYAVYAAVVVLLYRFFEPVDHTKSLAAATTGITGCIVGALSLAHQGPPGVNQLFVFGIFDILIGWLILKSKHIPNAFGSLMILAGVGWIIYVTPGTTALAPYLAALGIVAEVALMLRLLIARSTTATSTT